jgi:hypothetical protein
MMYKIDIAYLVWNNKTGRSELVPEQNSVDLCTMAYCPRCLVLSQLRL